MSTTHFPAAGHVYEANFGSWVHHLHFESETVMTLTTADGPFQGASEIVQIAVTPSWQIRDNLFWGSNAELYVSFMISSERAFSLVTGARSSWI